MTNDSGLSHAPRDPVGANRRFYDALWSHSALTSPESFNTWPLISRLLAVSPARLEVGPGLRPRLPLKGTHFVDLCLPVVERIAAAGGVALGGEITQLPLEDGGFDLVCAFDILEHVEEDGRALAELARVLKPGGLLLLSVPLYRKYWTEFDALVGHVRRYEPAALRALLADRGLCPEEMATYGMQPKSPALLRLGTWFLRHRPESALFWYNRLLLPLGLMLQRRLQLRQASLDPSGIGEGVCEILLMCRKTNG